MKIRLPGRFWFKPRPFGFGATPVTWEGWALTALYLAGEGAIFLTVFAGPIPADAPRLILFAAGTLVLTLVFVLFVWLKTEGTWRWRWGGDDGRTRIKILLTRDDGDDRH